MNDDATSPCSIRIFLRDGRPDGIRPAEKTMSTTQAIAFRRSQLARAQAVFGEDLRRPGVYILLGADDAATDGRVAYIGESEGIGRRLAIHASPQGRKELWEDTIILVPATTGRLPAGFVCRGWPFPMVEVVSMADRIRRYARERWVEPVREAGRAAVSIRAQPMWPATWALATASPLFCSALESSQFLREAGRRLVATALENEISVVRTGVPTC